MQQRDLLVAEKGVRHAAQSGALRDGAIETDAVRDRAGRAKPDKAGAALFTAGDRLGARDLSPAEKADLIKSRDVALTAIHGYADWLERRLPGMVPFSPMGEENYNYLLKNVYLLPIDAKQLEMLGQTELGRYRGLESMLPDPSFADPNPARSA